MRVRTSPIEVEQWMLMVAPESGTLIVLVVDDQDDDELTAAVARENQVPADGCTGSWDAGERDGCWLLAFRLVDRSGGWEREFVTDNIYRELLDAVLDVPHLVVIMPREIAGDARTAEEIAPRVAGSLLVEVAQRSPRVAQVRAERDD